MSGMLLDLQNRGQLAAGFGTYNPDCPQIINTFKYVGTVGEAFRMSHRGIFESILREYAGPAAIGHARYATSGADDIRYAQPFERQHGQLWKWFGMPFNGTLSNFVDLRERLLSQRGYHFTLNSLAYQLWGEKPPDLKRVMSALARSFDGAYSIDFLDATGRMFVARDPLGFRPMS